MATNTSTHVIHVPTTRVAEAQQAPKQPPNIWHLFFRHCLDDRVQGPNFHELSDQLWDEVQVGSLFLANQLLDCQRKSSMLSDALYAVYMEDLLVADRIAVSDILYSLLLHSRYYTQKLSREPKNSPDLESSLITLVMRQFLSNNPPKQPHQARELLIVLYRWMQAISKPEQLLLDPNGSQLLDAIGALTIAVLENSFMILIMDKHCSPVLLGPLSVMLPTFLSLWTHTVSQSATENANRLAIAINSRPSLKPKSSTINEKQTALAQATLQVEAVPDLAIVPTRAAMFIFLLSLTYARPISDDILIINYLQMKYKISLQIEVEALAIDLVVGAFDVLSAAVARKESESVILSLKSFLINKIPTLLTTIATSMFQADRPEYCIGQALSRIDNVVFPPPSFGMISENALQDVRQDFLFSCTLHGLIRGSSIETLLGEAPSFSQPPLSSARYTKETLAEQCASDPERITQLIDELDKMNGNAGAISLAVVETIRNLCMNKDTITLKTISNSLSTKLKLLDIMMQFATPTSLVQPLCQLLDEWRYEDDQGEYQPVYEEFAAVFLLTLIIIHQFDLSVHDLGVSRDSFVPKYLDEGSRAKSIESLSEEEKKQVTIWLRGLFNPDSMSDEVLSCCRPQEFYLLAPTIYSQICYATQRIIPPESTKTPVEYLCEPFLIPSLVGILTWIVNQCWKHRGNGPEMSRLVRLLFELVKPQQNSESMHKAVIAMTSAKMKELFQILVQKFQQRLPPAVLQFATALKSSNSLRRTNCEPFFELRALLTASGSLQGAFKTAFQSLISWGTAVLQNPIQGPPGYNHRLFHSLLGSLSADQVLSLLLDEIKAQSCSSTGNASLALDIAVAFICAPTPGSQLGPTDWMHSGPSERNGRMTLREALSHAFDEAPQTIRTDAAFTEALVHLHRRVEMQLSLPLTGGISDIAAQAIIPELAMAEGAAAVAAAEIAAVAAGGAANPDAMDFTAADPGVAGLDILTGDAGLSLNMDLDATGGLDLLGSGTGLGNDDDIFAGLMGVDDIDFNNY